MLSRNFPFTPNFNFGTDNLMVEPSGNLDSFPPVVQAFALLDGQNFELLDGGQLLLL